MQRHPRAGLVSIDEARVRPERCKAGFRSGTLRKLGKGSRQGRPGPPALGVEPVVTIALAVGEPGRLPAVGHRGRHPLSAGSEHAPEWGRGNNLFDAGQQLPLERQGKARKVSQAQLARAIGAGLLEEIVCEAQFRERHANPTLHSVGSSLTTRWRSSGTSTRSSIAPAKGSAKLTGSRA